MKDMKVEKAGYCAHVLFALVITILMCSGAAAQDEARLVLKTEVAKEIRVKEGNAWIMKYVPVEVTKPGDVLFYRITYFNEGTAPAVGAVIADPVPEGTVYLPDSAIGSNTAISFSIDGGNTYQRPPVLYVVVKPDGSKEEKEAPPEMYTHIRWMTGMPVPPGHSGELGFKVRVK